MSASPIITAAPTRQITLSGGNAFEVASIYLGDATQVDRIMAINPQLNGDPWFTGRTIINLPSVKAGAGNGGIIGG